MNLQSFERPASSNALMGYLTAAGRAEPCCGMMTPSLCHCED